MMLTAVVNIAVFAAFQMCIERHLLADAEFKGVCRPHELDIWCYERQTRQDRGKDGKVSGKRGKGTQGCGCFQAAMRAAAIG